MQPDDFFVEVETAPDVWGRSTMGKLKLNRKLLDDIRKNTTSGIDDLSCAIPLLRLVWDELETYGTGGGQTLDDSEIEQAQRSLRAVLERLSVPLDIPWRNFKGFRTYWTSNDAYGSYQARRQILDDLFNPVQNELERQENAEFRASLAEATSPHDKLGWPQVDEELDELRRRFRTARSSQDYRDVGNRCVAALEAIGRVVFDAERHVRPGEEVPALDKSKNRIERYVEDSLAGKGNEKLRGVAKKVIELAHSVKHSNVTTRRESGIAADAVIMLAHILRRVEQDL